MKRSPGLNWGFIFVILFTLFFWGVVIANAQMVNLPAVGEVARANRTLRWGWLDDHIDGFTICLDNPAHGVSFILAGQGPIDREDTEAHEAIHRRQIRRLGSCEAFEQYTATPRGKLLAEAEAYAAGACVSVILGSDRKLVEEDYSNRIAYYVLGGAKDPRQIVPILQWFERKRCPEIFPVEVSSVYSYPVMGYAVYSQGTLLAGHGWSRT